MLMQHIKFCKMNKLLLSNVFGAYSRRGKRFIQSGFDASYLQKCAANYVQLTPISFIERAALQYPKQLAYIHGKSYSVTWEETYLRVRKWASALYKQNIRKNDVVSIIAPNTPSIFEAHFAIPGVSGVIHTINTRLDAKTIAFQLDHGSSKILFVDTEFTTVISEALNILKAKGSKLPLVIYIHDKEYKTKNIEESNGINLEEFIASGDDNFALHHPADEWDAISLNYTSGTTGNPKGVVIHHRGAYLNSLSNLVEWNMHKFPQFLWVVPMFHCNGWNFCWSMSASIGCSYFLRQIRADSLFDVIEKYKVQYLCGAPVTMLTMLAYDKKIKFSHDVYMWTAGAPPPPAVIKRFSDELNVKTQTAYGLTETYGPISCHNPDPTWITAGLTAEERLNKCTYQVGDATIERLIVCNPETMEPVPTDGKTIGEVMIKGNIVMKGYLNNENATLDAFKSGYFHTGDLGVNHGNGRIELKDRSKDIIISGGENISSIEVENIMITHPHIGEAAAIAMPDEKWGEVPCLFFTLRPGITNIPSHDELISFAKSKMASFQTPKKYVYLENLPKTSTGKVQKNLLREKLPKK